MRIPMFVIAAASLIALGGLAQADDHLFQANKVGGLTSQGDECCFTRTGHAIPNDNAPGRGSPWTAFEEEDLGIPSTRTPQAEDPNNPKTNPAKPHCDGCVNPALE
jgi:hypothetical protein